MKRSKTGKTNLSINRSRPNMNRGSSNVESKGFDNFNDEESSDDNDIDDGSDYDEDDNNVVDIEPIGIPPRKITGISDTYDNGGYVTKKRRSEQCVVTDVQDPSMWETSRATKHPQGATDVPSKEATASTPRRTTGRKQKSYEGECGYWLVKLFRGHSLSRTIKRRLLKYAILQLLFGMILLVIAGQENNVFLGSKYFNEVKYGGSLLSLMFFASIPSFLLGNILVPMIVYWQSIHTNIALLVKLLKLYFICDLIAIFGIIWCIIVLFLTFAEVKSWTRSEELTAIRPYYIATIFFMCPFLLIKFYFISEVSYLNGEMAHFGCEDELDAPPPTHDLSALSLSNFLLLVLISPVVLTLMLYHSIISLVSKCCGCHPQNDDSTGTSDEVQKSTNWSRFRRKMSRYYKRCLHLCCVCYELVICCDMDDVLDRWKRIRTTLRLRKGSDQVHPSVRYNQKVDHIHQRALQESVNPVEEEGLDDGIRDFSHRIKPISHSRRSSDSRVSPRPMSPRLELNDIEQQHFESENSKSIRSHSPSRHHEHAATLSSSRIPSPTKNLEFHISSRDQFDALWPTLLYNESFGCELIEQPDIRLLREHIEKQGFYISFMSISGDDEAEYHVSRALSVDVGVCNIKEHQQDSWFLALFSFDESLILHSEVKCSNESELSHYVERFELDKVLRIRNRR